MKKKNPRGAAFVVALLAIGFCLGFAQTSFGMIVYFDATGPLFEDVASVQFDILGPVEASLSNFEPNLQSGWVDFSTGNTVSLFDADGTSSLQNGVIGTFDIDVVLGNFELGDQGSNVISENLYNIVVDGNDYRISSVPIPSALILLGSGLAGLIGFRRKRMN